MAVFNDERTLRKDLDKYPSNFDLDLPTLTKDRVTNIIKKLNSDQTNTTKLKTEDIQISNFLSYLYFLLEDSDHARQCNDESLQKDPDNIIANANKARFLLEAGEMSEVEDIITKLQDLEKREDYNKRKCYAKADLAYAYSRSGPWYHQRAVDLYSEVLEAYPMEYAWQFGLGLTLLRQTHRFSSQADDRFDSKQNERTKVRASELLLAVATKSGDQILCAKAYARLGKAMYSIEKGEHKNVTREIQALNSKSCFEKAVEICPEEPSVLETCGQHARYRWELDMSEKLLRKSLQIKPTCHAYHHLALTLKRRVECGLDRTQPRVSPGHRYPSHQMVNEYQHQSRGYSGHRYPSHQMMNEYQHQPRGYSGHRYPSHQMVNEYQHQPRGYPGHGYPSQTWNYPGYQERSQETNYNFHVPLDRYGQSVFNSADYAHDSCWDNNGNVNFNGGWNDERKRGKKSMRSLQGGHNRRRDSSRSYSQRGNVQKRGSSSTSHQPQRKQGQNLRNITKSPLKVRVHSENKLLIEAVALLEKTEELDQYALGIQYDKGIIYRMLGQIEKAVDVFKQILSKREYLSTTTLLTNIYEQLGLCLLELSQYDEVSTDIQRKYKKDGQGHLLNAVQIQSEIVANDPQFKEAWNSYPTLKELFSDKRDGKPRQLAVLHMLMGDHKDSISIYEELFLKEEEAEMKPEDYINMIECYKKDGQHEKCVSLLTTLECTEIFSDLPPSLVFDVYIAGAFHAYTTDNAHRAYQHFRRAFRVYGMFDKTNDDQSEVDEDEDTKDLLILHSCSQKWKCKHPRNLGTILEECMGLQYTVNTDNVLANAMKSEAMVSIIQKIPCIIIMTHDSADAYDKRYVDLALNMNSENSRPQVLVVSDDKNNIPDITRTKPFIRMPPPLEGTVDPIGQTPEEHQEWIKEFITMLKPK